MNLICGLIGAICLVMSCIFGPFGGDYIKATYFVSLACVNILMART